MVEVISIQNAAHGANLCGIVEQNYPPSLMKISQTLYEHRVIIIGIRNNKATYLKFGRLWGTPIPHVLDHMRILDIRAAAVGNKKKKIVRRI